MLRFWSTFEGGFEFCLSCGWCSRCGWSEGALCGVGAPLVGACGRLCSSSIPMSQHAPELSLGPLLLYSLEVAASSSLSRSPCVVAAPVENYCSSSNRRKRGGIGSRGKGLNVVLLEEFPSLGTLPPAR